MNILDHIIGHEGELWDRSRSHYEGEDFDFDFKIVGHTPLLQGTYHFIQPTSNNLALTEDGIVHDISYDHRPITMSGGYQTIINLENSDKVWIKKGRRLVEFIYKNDVASDLKIVSEECDLLLRTLSNHVVGYISGKWSIIDDPSLNITFCCDNAPRIEYALEVHDRFLIVRNRAYVVAGNSSGMSFLDVELEPDYQLIGISSHRLVPNRDYHQLIMVCKSYQTRVVLHSLDGQNTRLTVGNSFLNKHINQYYPIGFVRFRQYIDSDCLVCSDGSVIDIGINGEIRNIPIPLKIFRRSN